MSKSDNTSSINTTNTDIAESNAEEAKGVVRSTITMSMATLLSRITGFARTWACAFALGNTFLASSYQIANNIPNMIYELVAGGVLTTAFLPVYMTCLERRGKNAAGDFASNLLSIAAIVLGVVSLLASVFAPQIVATQTLMSTPEEAEVAVYFFRFFALQVIFYGIGAIISGILNAHKSFLWPALAPVFNNIVVVITMVGYVFISAVNTDFAQIWLAVGTVLGVVVMFAVQVPALIKQKIPLRFHINLHDSQLKETLRVALPAIIFIIINLAVVSVRNSVSMGVSLEGPSTLSYARLWYQFPYGVLAVALSTAMLTEMSAASANEDWSLFRRNVRQGLSGTLFLILPLSALMLVLSESLSEIYHAGSFTAEDVSMVAEILQYWCISLPFYAGYMYLFKAFSAMKSLGQVTKIDAICRIGQASLYAILSLGVGDWSGFGLIGIPIADIIFYFAMFLILCILMQKKVGNYRLTAVLLSGGKSLIASVIAALVAFGILLLFGTVTNIGTALIAVIVCGIAGLLVFYGLSRLFKIHETSLIDEALLKVFSKVFRRNKA